MTEAHWMAIANLAEFGPLRRLVRTVGGVEILLLQTSAGVIAVRNRCTHLGNPLDQGRIIGGRIHCPWHDACFDLTTGSALSGPAVAPLTRYPVRIDGPQISVRVTEATAGSA